MGGHDLLREVPANGTGVQLLEKGIKWHRRSFNTHSPTRKRTGSLSWIWTHRLPWTLILLRNLQGQIDTLQARLDALES